MEETVVVAYTYDAWGKLLSTTGTMASTLGADNPLRYRGYVYDEETGLYYLTSRYYNPSWGRFINADIFVSTGQGFVGCNMFAYCNNNPVSMADSNGTVPFRTFNVAMTDSGRVHFTPINGQNLAPLCDMVYGNSTIGYSGCEVIASYMFMKNFVDLSVLQLKDGRTATVVYASPDGQGAYVEVDGTNERFDVTEKDVEKVLWTP